MAKSLFIAEKPSVAQEFANALKLQGRRGDGYIESDQAVVTWCVGHLVKEHDARDARRGQGDASHLQKEIT